MLTPVVLRVALFTAAYTLAAVAGSLLTGNAEFVMYIAVMVVLIAGVLLLHARVHLPEALLWCLSIWGLMHMAGGLVPVPESWPVKGESHVLYSLWIWPGRLKYDHITHAYGFAVATWACWCGLRAMLVSHRARGEENRSLRPTFGMLLLCVLAGIGLGAVNEVVEFAATLLLPETNVGGYLNTGWDLVSNLTGAVIAALLIRVLSPETDSPQRQDD